MTTESDTKIDMETNTETLENISCKAIRQQWNTYVDNDITNSHLYEIVWKDWETVYAAECRQNIFYPLLKKFIMGESISQMDNYQSYYHVIPQNENTLILKGLDGKLRKDVHSLCDKLGLHHNSVESKKNRHLWIYKPKVWLWEFTEKNPYSKSDEYYAKREQNRLQQQQKSMERLKRKYCDGCDANGWDTQLYCSVYICELYCDDCLETLTDDNGDPLNCHKFEPIR